MSKPHLTMYVGASDVARLLELKNPAVVTNWRSRYPSFPAERVGGGQPRFDLVEILEWLRNDGPRGRAVHSVAPLTWWAEVVRAFVVVEAKKRSLRTTALALVLVRQLARHGQGMAEWKRLLEVAITPVDHEAERPMGVVAGASAALHRIGEWVEQHEPRAEGLVAKHLQLDDHLATFACDLVGALERAADVSDHDLAQVVINASVDGQQRHEPRRTIDDLAAVMVALAQPASGETVFDPAAGEGTVLLEAVRRAGTAQAVGQEADSTTWEFIRLRFLIEQQPLDPGRHAADSLDDDQHRKVRADLVLLDPPLDPRSSQLARWIDLGLEHLAPSGRMVIALPLSELVSVRSVRRLPDDRVRGRILELAAQGRISAIVVLPRWARTDVASPMAIVAVGASQPQRSIAIVALDPSGRRADQLGDHGRAMVDVLLRDGVDGLIDDDLEGVDVAAASSESVLEVLEDFTGDELGARVASAANLGSRMFSSASRVARETMSSPMLFSSVRSADMLPDFVSDALSGPPVDPLDDLIERLRSLAPSQRAEVVHDFLRQLDER